MKRVLFAFGLALTLSVLAENRKVIAVVDTGINWEPRLNIYRCNLPEANFSGEGMVRDVNGHGTTVAALIARSINPTTTCILNVKYYHNKDLQRSLEPLYNALRFVISIRADYANLSYSGKDYDSEERRLINLMLTHGIKVVAAAGNNGMLLTPNNCNAYPACYDFTHPNYYVVTNYGRFSNRGYRAKYILNSEYNNTGTSFSTALFTGRLAAGMVK